MTDAPVNVNFSELFSLNHLYIPDFQRGYSWTKNQLDDLWLDIEQIPEGKHHYCGSILTVKLGEIRTSLPAPARVFELELVDGQQRCTTVFLLLLAIRDKFRQIDVNHDVAKGIDSGFIHFTPHEGSIQLRLKNAHDDLNNFMIQMVAGNDPNPTVAPEKRIVEAKAFFDEKIAEFSEVNLEDLRYKVTTKLTSTEVYLDETLDRPTVFEAINNRGLGLSDMDKLKNYSMLIISRIDELAEENINFENKWFSALQHLMKHNLYNRTKEDKMLRFYWMLFEGKRESEPFNEFRKTFSPLLRDKALNKETKEKLISKFKDYAEGFVKFAEAFTEIESRSHTYRIWGNGQAENNSRGDAELLHEKQDNMDYSDTFLSVVIASYMRFDHNEYITILDTIEKTLFRVYRIFNKTTNHGYSLIAKLSSDIYFRKVNAFEVDTWCRDFAKDEGSLRDMEKALEDMINCYKWGGIKYFLHEYERELSGGRCIRFTGFPNKRESIEHILPQNPRQNSYWNKIIKKTDDDGNTYSEERFNYEEKATLTHRLGNLSLTQNNSFYYNHDYPRKRNGPALPQEGNDDLPQPEVPCYANASTHQEKKIAADYEDWDPMNIRKRDKELIKFAKKRWRFLNR